MADQIDPTPNQTTPQGFVDNNAARPPGGGSLRGGTQGGDVARAVSGISPEGTEDVASPAGGIHVATPRKYVPGVEVGDDQHHLAGGKSPNDVRRYLREVTFPTKKDHLVRAAAINGAPDEVIRSLTMLPATDYGSFEDVIRDFPRLPEREDFADSDRDKAGPGAREV